MDPQAAWNEARSALEAGDIDRAKEALGALVDWVNRGGFPPNNVSKKAILDSYRILCETP